MEEKSKIKYSNEIIIVLGLALFLIWGGFYLSYPWATKEQGKFPQKQEEPLSQRSDDKIKTMAFDNLDLEAKAFVVYNIETDELLAGKNENQILSLASITKIMTTLVASEQFDPNSPITIKGEGGIFRSGEKWSFANLAAVTLVSSSNEGALALAGDDLNFFIQKMNEKARELNLEDLHFTNPTGLDNNPTPGGQGSALSVAKLFSYIVKNKPTLFDNTKNSTIQEKSLDGLDHLVINTNEVANNIPGLLISKTGYTTIAGGNLAIVANLGLRRPMAIVVLGSTEKGRFLDTQKLVGATLNYYSNLAQINEPTIN